ncbi:ComEC/Rec2 family competence protein [Candidatus Kaiserbacteria bacterium]|nr:ComEC/Rec2 family competence protein [Candidatus Kaiserbacteria bacterium]
MMSTHVLWAIVLGFLAGIFLRSFVPLGVSFVSLLSLSAVAVLILSARQRAIRGVFVAVALLACGAGVLRMDAAVLVSDPALASRVGEKVTLEGVVFNEPDAREASVRIPLRLETGTGILVVAPAHAAVRYGDHVRAEGVLRLPSGFETGLGREFNYPAYLAKDGIGYELSFAGVEVVGRGGANPLKTFAIETKRLFLEGLGRALPEPAAGLAGGITAGDKRGLGAELSDVFRTVGLTHIIVLSGYNIMIVVLGLGWLLQKLYAPRAWKVLLGIGIAVLFALITGLASASVRAAAMASIALVGAYTGRLYVAARALGAVALAMVVWNPYVLAFDPGFQLSVIATVGLIAFTPRIAPRLSFVTTKGNLREIFATTLSAQIAVLPLLLYQTGQVPLYSLPVNLLALVAVPWAMLFSAIAALGGIILGPLATFISLPAYVLLSYLVDVAQFFSALPYASLALPTFSAWWLVLLYGGMLLWVLRREKFNGTEMRVSRAAARG